jgi:DNA-binding transcriptional ArsR family regulator
LSLDDPASRLEALQVVMDALAHPARRQIMLVIRFRGGAMTAGDIAARFSHSWPTTTRHLRVLESAGLITQEKQGRTRIYRLVLERLAIAKDWLKWFDPVTEG